MTKLARIQGGTALALPDDFVDVDAKTGWPLDTLSNTRVAISKLPIEFSYDKFRDKRFVGKMVLADSNGQINDDALTAIRVMIRERYRFEPGKNNTWDAINLYCREHGYHPVLDYLNPLVWDGVARLETWMIDYMGAPDTPFVRAVSCMMLVASVRRVRYPGTKFDYICVLESPEGYNKSSTLAMLYGPENFSDQSILGLSDKELQEAVRGRWGLECADLSGMRKAEVEKIKAQLSRQEDRTRPAYGRAVLDAPRSVVFWGSTNDNEYLRSQHGNRRFLPVPVGRIDVDGLAAIRDQLWAEASCTEALGISIMLPEKLWLAAGKEQEARTFYDPWRDIVKRLSTKAQTREPYAFETMADGEERVASHFIMATVLGIEEKHQNPELNKRLGLVMRKEGWTGPKPVRIHGHVVRGYSRQLPDPTA